MNTVNGTGHAPNLDPATITGGTAMVTIDARGGRAADAAEGGDDTRLWTEPGGTFEFAARDHERIGGGYRVDRFDHGRPGRSRDDLLRCRSESNRATL